MSRAKLYQSIQMETAEAGWSGLYRAAGVGVLVTVVFILVDIALSFTGGDVPTGGLSSVEWFGYFQNHPLLGLRNLGLYNVIEPMFMLPLYLALYQLHRKGFPGFAALVFILWLLGVAIYSANNRALSMLTLSHQYAAAATEAQKGLLAAAGTVTLAQAEDFTPGTFLGLFLQNAAGLGMLLVMLRGRIFSRQVALLGLVGSGALLFFTVSVTFVPAIFNLAMLFALTGGLMMLVWNILMALAMFRLGRQSLKPGEQPAGPAHLYASEEGMGTR